MANRKYGYQDFRYDDLTGGINVRDYPSEIEDKQSLYLKNWNFDGNKLVSEKGFSNTGLPARSNIGALTVDGLDIWTVSDGIIYKNGTSQGGKKGILIKTDISKFIPGIEYIITIDGIEYRFVGDTIKEFIEDIDIKLSSAGFTTGKQDNAIFIISNSTINISQTKNQTYILYNRDIVASYELGQSITAEVVIDGTEYTYVYNYENGKINPGYVDIEIMTGLKNQIPSNYSPEIVNLDVNLKVVEDYDSYAGIIINNANSIDEKKRVEYRYRYRGYSAKSGGYAYDRLDNGGDTLFTINGSKIYSPFGYSITYPYNVTDDIMSSDTITIDGVTVTFPDNTDFGDFGLIVESQLEASLIFNAGSVLTFDDGGNVRYQRVCFFREDGELISSISGTGKFSDISSFPVSSFDNQSYVSPYFEIRTDDCYGDDNTTYIRDFVRFDTTKIGDYTENFIKNQIEDLGLNASPQFYEGKYGLLISRNNLNYLDISFDVQNESSIPNIVGTHGVVNLVYEGAFIDIKTNKQTEVDVIDLQGSNNLVMGNITIGNNGGVLFVDLDEGGASYLYNDAISHIGEDSIGLPTVGTIYNGKIVLGGYEGNDNIIFSKTSSPTHPLNILNFTDYDSGGQSVSGGDKGEVTGMMVSENGLYVFKDNSIWYTNSEKNDPNSLSFNFIFRKITSNGALTQNVITEVDQEIFYLDWKNRGVKRLGYERHLTTLRDTAISKEIKKLLDELPEEQPLATSHFKYPYYTLSLSDNTSGTITYPNGNTYYLNNKHFIYNVDNKSWTTKTGVDDMIISHKGHFVKNDGMVYEDFVGNTTENGEHESKELTFFDDVDYKRYKEFEVVGDIKGIGGTKNLELQILVDEEELDIGEKNNPYKRIISAEDGQTLRFREKVDLFDDGQRFKYKLLHSGNGYVEISDINIRAKGLDVFHSEYY